MLTVVGEALIDLVDTGDHAHYRAHPGGSPLNVAVGLARLGHRTSMLARLAADGFGRLLRGHAEKNGIDLEIAQVAREPSTLAAVSLDDAGEAEYEFYVNGTADWQWVNAELTMPADTKMVHFGSLASWLPPGDESIANFALRAQETALVSYDPNVRPRLIGAAARGRSLVERNIRAAHLVKASEADVSYLYPSSSPKGVAARWLELGPSLIVITDGESGSTAYRHGQPEVDRPAVPAAVVDTVGAGDAFMAGLLGALADADATPWSLAMIDNLTLARMLDHAALVAALACERAGADPPTRAEVHQAKPRSEAHVFS